MIINLPAVPQQKCKNYSEIVKLKKIFRFTCGSTAVVIIKHLQR
nr:MAG TPA: hypothetical protein [Caudoviricetes sp.]